MSTFPTPTGDLPEEPQSSEIVIIIRPYKDKCVYYSLIEKEVRDWIYGENPNFHNAPEYVKIRMWLSDYCYEDEDEWNAVWSTFSSADDDAVMDYCCIPIPDRIRNIHDIIQYAVKHNLTIASEDMFRPDY